MKSEIKLVPTGYDLIFQRSALYVSLFQWHIAGVAPASFFLDVENYVFFWFLSNGLI